MTAVYVVWSIGLVGALVATLVILKEVALVLRVLRDIHRLAVITRRAALGMARNLEAVPKLAALAEPARAFTAAQWAVLAGGATPDRSRVPDPTTGEGQ